MAEQCTILDYKSRLVDEIAVGDPLNNTCKIRKIGRVYREFKTSEIDNPTPFTPLSIVPGLKDDAISNNWRYTDFFPTRPHIQVGEGNSVNEDIPNCRANLAVNKAGTKGAPYIMYSNDGLKYTVRKERATNNTDTSIKLYRESTPIRIGLYQNTSIFLEDSAIDIIECTNLSQYRIETKNAIDMAMPEKDMAAIPVLREIDKSKGLNTKKMYLDRVDMTTGKIDNYILLCYNAQNRFKRISNTWHPKQYICMCSNKVAIIDIREKRSNLFWEIKRNQLGPPETFMPHQKAEKGQDSKIHITLGRTLGTYDMRNLTSIYGGVNTSMSAPILSVGKHIAVYNRAGRFFFQNPHAPEDTILKIYDFNPSDIFIGFDWTGKSFSAPYSIAAFLFHNKVCVYYGDGTIAVHNVSTKRRNAVSKPQIALRAGRIINMEERIAGIIDKSLLRNVVINQRMKKEKTAEAPLYTVLERSLKNGFRDPLDTDQPNELVVEPSEAMKKAIYHTKLIDLVPIADRTGLLKPKHSSS